MSGADAHARATVLCALLVLAALLPPRALAQPPNLLFVIVDDLAARLEGAFAQPGLTPSTPNIVRLQKRGVTFSRMYTRVTVCSPSRTALLTGMRPERTRLWTIGPYWRNTTARAGVEGTYVTLPEALKARGLNTTGAGKVWHPGTSSGSIYVSVGGDDMPFSWSYPAPPDDVDPRLIFWECDCWTNATGQSSRSAGLPGGQGCVTSPACVACLERYNATLDDTFAFFVGFKRPHLGFFVPDRFLDLYPADVPLAAVRAPVADFPRSGWYPNGEIRGYPDISPVTLPNSSFPGMLRDEKHAELRRAYYASVSMMDDSGGKLVDALDAAPRVANSTWIVFTSDHGYQLGEHGNFGKETLEENTARVPLIIVPPAGPAGDSFLRGATVGPDQGAFVSMLDLYPTFAELFNLTVPDGQLDGSSLVPLLRGENGSGQFDAAFSQIVRQEPAGGTCRSPDEDLYLQPHPSDSDPPRCGRMTAPGVANCTMGLSVRVISWRYVVWVEFDFGAAATNGLTGPRWSLPNCIRGEELYDHAADDDGDGLGDNDFDTSEAVNVAHLPAFATIKTQLLELVKAEYPEPAAGNGR